MNATHKVQRVFRAKVLQHLPRKDEICERQRNGAGNYIGMHELGMLVSQTNAVALDEMGDGGVTFELYVVRICAFFCGVLPGCVVGLGARLTLGPVLLPIGARPGAASPTIGSTGTSY